MVPWPETEPSAFLVSVPWREEVFPLNPVVEEETVPVPAARFHVRVESWVAV